jgi:ferrous iron transport protein B
LSTQKQIALVGNPNSGKTSLFNALTGLNQKVGNFSGVTVEGKIGIAKLPTLGNVNFVDLPGTYSLYPRSADELVTYEALLDKNSEYKPDAIVIVADASNLKRNLLFASQIIDLGMPTMVALTMADVASKKGIIVDAVQLSIQLGVPVVVTNPLRKRGTQNLLRQLETVLEFGRNYQPKFLIDSKSLAPELIAEVQQEFKGLSNYASIHLASEISNLNFATDEQKAKINSVKTATNFSKTKVQSTETMARYKRISQMMQAAVVEEDPLKKELRTEQIDKTLLHPIWGNLVLLAVLFLLFQSIYWLSAFPTEWIEQGFAWLTNFLNTNLPQNALSNLLVNGVLSGLGGIIGFVPQIAILFALITVLEDSGYMARIAFLSDRLMRSAGLNGRAVLPLISGVACAVPAIMSTRTIENKWERLIAIMVTPLMSCSARLPVYTILIGMVIPNKYFFGFISLQALVMMGLYLFGFVLAMLAAKIISMALGKRKRSAFVMELPIYREPRWQNLLVSVWQKVRLFVVDAGKVIVVISVILWMLCNYGPGNKIQDIKAKYATELSSEQEAEQANEILTASYAGHIGKFIEPAIKPLGFDWKIGIAIVASFAAREVFVGTMATLYSAVDANEYDATLRQKMQAAQWPDKRPVYTLASGVSLMLFYAIALQCMTTMGIVKRETKSWFWAAIQFVVFGFLAYAFAFLAYIILA